MTAPEGRGSIKPLVIGATDLEPEEAANWLFIILLRQGPDRRNRPIGLHRDNHFSGLAPVNNRQFLFLDERPVIPSMQDIN